MSGTDKRVSGSVFFYSAALCVMAMLAVWFVAHPAASNAQTTKRSELGGGVTFPGSAGGAIPDGPGAPTTCGSNGAPFDITFNVSGLNGSVTDVRVDTNITHTWVGDLTVTLKSPGGAPVSHVLFGRTGATTSDGCGDSSNLGGGYNFFDLGTGQNWWDEAFFEDPMRPGDYQTTQLGGAGQTDPAPTTSMNTAFNGVTDANGTWTLSVTDGGQGDTGSINSASLTLTTSGGTGGKTDLDFDDDGNSDVAVVRSDTQPFAFTEMNVPLRHKSMRERMRAMRDLRSSNDKTDNVGPTPVISWWVSNSFDDTLLNANFGDPATDFLTPSDFDGDGKTDIAVWRTGAQGTFYILQSSDSTVRTELFGQSNDNPSVVGDYDGDGKSDPAVFRCPDTVPGPCNFFYRGSNNNPGGDITFIFWGSGTINDTFPSPGDFDGDGKFDFNIQKTSSALPVTGSNAATFVLLRSSDFGVEYINWGFDDDFIAPGDVDGDNKDDICVVRAVGGNLEWSCLERDGGTKFATWGLTSDWIVTGDYDGDGTSDFGLYRPADATVNATCTDGPGNCGVFYGYFTGTDTFDTFQWGRTTDIPLGNWNVN